MPSAPPGPILQFQVTLGERNPGSPGRRIDLRTLTRRPFVLLFVALGSIEVLRLALDPRPADLVVLALVALVGLAAVREREAVAGLEGNRRTEAESFARILRGLARSASPDAIVASIAEELGAGTGADHVAVVRRRPDTRNLEAILTPTRAGAPASRTTLPLTELEDPADEQAQVRLAVAAARGRRLTPVPMGPDPHGDPQLAPLGISADWAATASSVAPGGQVPLGGAPSRTASPAARRSRSRHRRPGGSSRHRSPAMVASSGSRTASPPGSATPTG